MKIHSTQNPNKQPHIHFRLVITQLLSRFRPEILEPAYGRWHLHLKVVIQLVGPVMDQIVMIVWVALPLKFLQLIIPVNVLINVFNCHLACLAMLDVRVAQEVETLIAQVVCLLWFYFLIPTNVSVQTAHWSKPLVLIICVYRAILSARVALEVQRISAPLAMETWWLLEAVQECALVDPNRNLFQLHFIAKPALRTNTLIQLIKNVKNAISFVKLVTVEQRLIVRPAKIILYSL